MVVTERKLLNAHVNSSSVSNARQKRSPTTCQEAEQWRSKDKGSQSLDMKYLMEQTKPCPSCGVRTKKDGGCMYITCSSCKKPWCWQCGKSDHHVWECNRPPYSMEKEQADKDDTNRYLFYFERYYNHSQSVKFAEAQRDKAQKTISQLMDGGKTFQEVDFLCQAVELVVECRRVLMWTYAKAYCMKQPGPARELFEYQQSELEKFTEMLNKLTEESPEELNKESGKKKVSEFSKALNKYLTNIETGKTQKEEKTNSPSDTPSKNKNQETDATMDDGWEDEPKGGGKGKNEPKKKKEEPKKKKEEPKKKGGAGGGGRGKNVGGGAKGGKDKGGRGQKRK